MGLGLALGGGLAANAAEQEEGLDLKTGLWLQNDEGEGLGTDLGVSATDDSLDVWNSTGIATEDAATDDVAADDESDDLDLGLVAVGESEDGSLGIDLGGLLDR